MLTPLETADGSFSCLDAETGEWYHNRAGAYTEALVNYAMPSGWLSQPLRNTSIRLLDVCFGMGYNTWVFLAQLLEAGFEGGSLEVLALERDPAILQMIPLILKDPRLGILKEILAPFEHNIYYQTHCVGLDSMITVVDCEHFSLKIAMGDLQTWIPQLEGPYDLIFHDAFSPAKVPELWTVDLFTHYHRLLLPTNGKLLTYSAAGAVRGGLQEAGFHLYKTDPLGRKTGGTLASILPLEGGIPLSPAEEHYLSSRAGIPYRDPLFQGNRPELLTHRLQEQVASGRPSGNRTFR